MVPVFASPSAPDSATTAPAAPTATTASALRLAVEILIPVVVEVEAVLGPPPGPLALPRPPRPLLAVAETDGGAALKGGPDGPQTWRDVGVAETPDAGGGILGDGLGSVGDLVPALAETGVLEESHRDRDHLGLG